MKGLSKYIFNISPKKLAILIVVLPLILIVLHTTLSVIYRNLDTSKTSLNTIVSILTIIVTFCFLIPFLIWFFWLKGVVLSIEENDLGIPKKWFTFSYIILFVYIVFNIGSPLIQLIPEDFRYIFYSLSESISIAGLLISYPLICHYAARAIYVEKNNEVASFSKTIGYTLLHIFVPISIPFFHNYFSSVSSENQQLVKIYFIALGILILLAISAFILAILGLI